MKDRFKTYDTPEISVLTKITIFTKDPLVPHNNYITIQNANAFAPYELYLHGPVLPVHIFAFVINK